MISSIKMAGPAIRIYNFAKVLSSYMNVIVACPNKSDLPEMEFSIINIKMNIL